VLSRAPWWPMQYSVRVETWGERDWILGVAGLRVSGTRYCTPLKQSSAGAQMRTGNLPYKFFYPCVRALDSYHTICAVLEHCTLSG